MGARPKDLVGQTFGQLLVCAYEGKSKWLCWCRCGNFVDVRTDNLKSGNTIACGCVNKEVHKERLAELATKRKGITIAEYRRRKTLHKDATDLVNIWFGKK